MRLLGWASLAILLVGVGAPHAADEITVYRCESGGRVTLQDAPCATDQHETTRRMVRPQDPPPKPVRVAVPAETEAPPEPLPPPFHDVPPPFAPPPMFQCTDYDGEVRFTEAFAPNTRCVPLAVLGYRVAPGSPAAAACRWVRESCLQLDDETACEQFGAKLKQARSDALHASGSQAPYRKSEAERLARIVAESCRNR